MKKITLFRIALQSFLLVFYIQASSQALISFEPTSDISGSAFGTSVDIYNHDILVSSISNSESPGKVYLFNAENEIVQTDVFYPNDALADDNFGKSFSITGEYIAIGSPMHDTAFENDGAVYIYRKNNGNWTFSQKIISSEGNQNDHFGSTVKIINNNLFISAENDEPSGEDTNENKGSVCVYHLNGNEWEYIEKLSIEPVIVSPFSKESFGDRFETIGDQLWITSNFYSDFHSDVLARITVYKFENGNFVFQYWSQALSIEGDGTQNFCISGNWGYSYFNFNSNVSITRSQYENGNWVNFPAIDSYTLFADNPYIISMAATNDLLFTAYYHNQPTPQKNQLKYYKKTDGQWTIQSPIFSNGPENVDDCFGCAMAVSGDYLLVGAPAEGNGKAYTIDTNLLNTADFEHNKLVAYPNPTHDILYINNNSEAIERVEIYSVTGNLLLTESQKIDEASLGKFATGIYFVKLKYENASEETLKVIKN